MSFDKKLQSLRKTAGLSQEELAAELGVSRQAVSKWESGTSYPEMDKLILMTRLFKCTLDDLVNDEVRDSSIIKNKVSKGQTYIDSLLEFITKSINMFTSMKMSSILKVFIELIALILVVVCVSTLMQSIGDAILYQIFSGTGLYFIYRFLSSVYFIIIVALDIIIIFQFYKIRYLDYYDKLVYKYEVSSDNKKDIEDTDKEENKDIKENVSKERNERIIIRDPEHRPLAFLSFISSLIMLIFRVIVTSVSIPFIFLFLFFAVLLVILIYLISYNTVFIGLTIACVAAIFLSVLVIRTLNQYLFKKPYPTKLMFWILIGSLFVGCLGVGFSLITLRNFEFKEENNLEEITNEFDFSDKLYLNLFDVNDDGVIKFTVEDARDNIAIDLSYDSSYVEFEFDRPVGDINYLTLIKRYKDTFSTKDEINKFLDNLKNNTIVTYDYHTGFSSVSVRASEKHIKSLIGTMSEHADIYTTVVRRGGYTYYQVRETITNEEKQKVCAMDDYYRKCVEVIDNTFDDDFMYEYKDNKLLYDETRYICYVRDYGYVCTKNNRSE